MIELEFSKMSASGNDFVMIDNRDGKVYDRFPTFWTSWQRYAGSTTPSERMGSYLSKTRRSTIFAGDSSTRMVRKQRCAAMGDAAPPVLHS